ncbi:hypothetical protein, partial [Streptomyces boncukensis]
DQPARLLVADQVAGALYVLDLPDGRISATLTGRHLAEHAGFLALPGGRWAFADDLAGEVVVLDPHGPEAGRPLVAATVPVATPAEHLAADPAGRRLAVTTGLGRSGEPWSDVLTAVDLEAPDGPRAVRVRTRVGEPGVTLSGGDDPLVVLRHREPGALAAYRHADLLDAGPSCPPAAPLATVPLPDGDGHGDAYDPRTGLLFAAAGSGVHRARPAAGAPPAAQEPLSWEGPGRGYYLRLDPVRRLLWSCVRGGPADPARWPEWTNDAWFHHLDTGATGRRPLGPGLVFRLAVTRDHAAYTRVHPDGDELILLSCPPSGLPEVTARMPLPPMDGAPRAGGTPWDGVQRRAVAGSPGAALTAVTRGGHGEIHLFDRAGELATLTVPTPLDDGGHLALVTPGDGAEADPVGR